MIFSRIFFVLPFLFLFVLLYFLLGAAKSSNLILVLFYFQDTRLAQIASFLRDLVSFSLVFGIDSPISCLSFFPPQIASTYIEY